MFALFITKIFRCPEQHIISTSSFSLPRGLLHVIYNQPAMAPVLRSTTRTAPRLDLTQDQLFHLCIFYIYLSRSTEIVASALNRYSGPKPIMTADDVQHTYLHLHDSEHRMWIRASDMNRTEKELLKDTLNNHGGESRLMDAETIKPVASMACLRVKWVGNMRSQRHAHGRN